MDSLVNDEERILNLMAKFRLREVNPTDYDSKLAFWKQTIRDHCAKRSCALFSVQELKETFRWHGRVPSCLETVLLEMRSAGDAKRLSQFEESVSSWLTWSYRRILVEPLVQLIWGSSGSKEEADQEQYVLVDLIKEFADKIYELRKSASRDSTIGQNVVTWTGLRESVSDICSDEKTLMLTVKYLRYNGLIATSQDEDGEMIVKFRMTYEKTSPTITESDISALKLKKLTEQLDADIHKVNAEIDRLRTVSS